MRPTSSVVIPAINEEKYLGDTLTSIARMDVQPDEIIVVDGGSTDKTVQIARRFGARVIILERQGIGYARQKGLEISHGKIVACTDADTMVPAGWLNTIVEELAKPGVSCVYSGFNVPDGWWLYRFYINFIQPIVLIFCHMIGIPLAPGQNTAFWKEKALAVGGYPIDFKIAEDLEIARRLKTVGRVVYLINNRVVSSGRRGNEGFPMIWRTSRAFWYYFTKRKADKIGFPDLR